MENTLGEKKLDAHFLVTVGIVWGLAEAGLGLAIRACNHQITGSVMTAVALFFLATAFQGTKKKSGLWLLLAIVLAVKSLDLVLLNLPNPGGAVLNPMYAFVTEVFAFWLLISVMDKKDSNAATNAVMGGLMALVAVNLFPYAGYISGSPACAIGGYPESLYYAPIAVGLAAVTVPLGLWVGEKVKNSLTATTFRFSVNFAFDAISTVALIGVLCIDLFVRK